TSMLYKGTAVTRGEGRAVVAATGMNTELGLISSLTEEARESETPLEKRLDRLGRRLVYITLVIAAGVAVAGIAAGREIQLMLETTIALAVATVPEALPIVATVALGRGMLRMARRNALIKKLPAVETLGATSVIAVDKTGTLTEGRMTVRRIMLEANEVQIAGGPLTDEGDLKSGEETIDPDDIPGLRELLEVGALCTNASLEESDGDDDEAKFTGTGDPTEVALVVAARKAGIDREELLERVPEVEEKSFSRDTKMMATIHEAEGGYRVAIKGAPEAVLEISTTIFTPDGEQDLSDDRRQEWVDRTEDLAAEGLRVLAMAQKQMQDREGEVYEAATFLGLVGMIDPAREDVADAIQRCQDAGIRFVMMTGDQAQTAFAIAHEVGLLADDDGDHQRLIEGGDLGDPEELSEEERQAARKAQVLARVTPEQKLNLIDLHQEAGRTVAMTGDGVNDAPALKSADIGIAMGRRGTQVAREAADMVLEDDRLETIVAAVEQGRIIFGNIRQFVLFLFSVSFSEVLVVAVASVAMADWPLPILPLQILFLNVVTYVFPALALGTGEGPGGVMERDPRPRDESVMERPQWIDLAALSVIIAAPALASLWLATEWLGLEGNRVTTLAFMTTAGGQLLNVFNVRDRRSGVFVNDVTENPWVWGAVVLCLLLIAAAIFMPGLADVLDTSWPGTQGLLLAVGLSVVTLVLGQIYIGITNTLREGKSG
ncbi:MAG: cation-translocating P-type ATPase, partial [Armatimonadota bacterium]